MRTDLERFFNPRAIAVVGASQDLDTISGQPLKFLKSHGYAGALYPVNPRYAEVAGIRCYPSLAEVREACKGNFCRCGTYPKVFEAALAAAKDLRLKGRN